MALNQRLIEEQNVSKEQEARIIKLHVRIKKLFELAENNLDNYDVLINIAQDIEEIEFELQKNWNFPEDRNMHTWWVRIPGCTCPEMDNQDYLGTDMRIYNSDCPIHSRNLVNS